MTAHPAAPHGERPDPTERFSTRVDAYVRHRPGYPDALLDALRTTIALDAASVIADIGSGTGISTELLLRTGAVVCAVEPNAAMRAAAEAALGGNPRFRSVGATAEATSLPGASVDLVAAGQAFHWFEPRGARLEFQRILKPGGWVALFFNSRRTDGSRFLRDYEDLLQQFGTDYSLVNHRNLGEDALREFFGGDFTTHRYATEQTFDFEGLEGRLLSSSYVPAAGQPQHAPMLRRLRAIFDAGQDGGRVRFAYETELHLGRLTDVDPSIL